MNTIASVPLTARLRIFVVFAVLAAALPLLLHLPSGVAAGLVIVGLVSGWSALRQPLPTPLRVLLVVAISGAVLVGFGFRAGRDAGSALLLAMLVLKLSELRDIADARRLVAYTLFAPFAAFLQDQGPITLLLGFVATIGMLLALTQLARAPRPSPGLPVELRDLGHSLLLALPLALVGFWLFPRLPTPLWGLPENAVARSGISESMSPGDWIDLLADDRPAFRVRFEGPRPPSEALYWRGPVLTSFDGRTWRVNQWLSGFPAPVLPQGPVLTRYTLTLEPTDRHFVFALESPAGWPEGLALGFDASLRSREPQRAITQYPLKAVAITAFEPTLSEAMRRTQLGLPEGFNPRSLDLAQRWRTEAVSERAYVQRVLGWFKAEHAYSISAPPLGRHTVDEFLFDTQEGFCEHFASAFVVLMRAAGIPSRVVTGYAGGVYNRIGNFWVVRHMDAHAWAEVWFADEGWVRVDPTAAVAPERIFDTLENQLGGSGGFDATLRPMFDFGDSLREAWNNFVVAYDAKRQAQLLRDLGWTGAGVAQVGQMFVLMAALALGLTLLLLLRTRQRERDPLLRAWRVFLKRWAQRGLAKHTNETAAAFLRRLGDASPEAAVHAAPLVTAFVEQRYAAVDVRDASDLAERLRRFRPPMLRHR